MELIVAVYDDWGIGKDGDQPIALSADRKFFRETTKGSTVIVGRKTLAAFPGGRPLPNRVNVVLTRQNAEIPGVSVCNSVEETAEFCKNAESCKSKGKGLRVAGLLKGNRRERKHLILSQRKKNLRGAVGLRKTLKITGKLSKESRVRPPKFKTPL